jgi:hypothetical protein
VRVNLAADGRAGLGFTPFFRHLWRADSKRRAARDASRGVSRAVPGDRENVNAEDRRLAQGP